MSIRFLSRQLLLASLVIVIGTMIQGCSKCECEAYEICKNPTPDFGDKCKEGDRAVNMDCYGCSEIDGVGGAKGNCVLKDDHSQPCPSGEECSSDCDCIDFGKWKPAPLCSSYYSDLNQCGKPCVYAFYPAA